LIHLWARHLLSQVQMLPKHGMQKMQNNL